MRPRDYLEKLGFAPKYDEQRIDEGRSIDPRWVITVTPPPMLKAPPAAVTLTEDQYKRYKQWREGTELIQNALPELSKSEREILMTGLGDAEFNRLYPDEDAEQPLPKMPELNRGKPLKPGFVMIAIGLADGRHSGIFGQYLSKYDVEAFDGRGSAEWTDDPLKAIVFESIEAVMDAWNTQSKLRPLRPDGQPNKPLTAFTVSFAPTSELGEP